MDGRRYNIIDHRLTEEKTRDREMLTNLVLGEGKALYIRQSLSE